MPTERPWYINASINSYNMYGPYVETFTKRLVITLSSRSNTIIKENDAKVDIVSASVLLVEDLYSIINSIKYANDGFGVLINSSNYVLVWQQNETVYDQQTNLPYDVSHFDQELAKYDLKQKSIIDYTDTTGTEWIVTTTPLFNTSSGNSSGTDYALFLLIFSNKKLAMTSSYSLQMHIKSTVTNVTVQTMIAASITITSVTIIVFLIILYIVKPFEVMKRISKDIIHQSTVEDDMRDYSTLMDEALFNLTRTDEVGLLAADFYDIICLLHHLSMDKRNKPKYPLNPFYLSDIEVENIVHEKYITSNSYVDSSLLSSWRSLECTDLVTVMKKKRLYEQAVLNSVGCVHNEAKENNKHNDRNVDLDVLRSLKTARSNRRIHPIEDDGDTEVVNDIERGIYQVSQPTSLNVGNSITIASSSMITSPAFMASKIFDIKKKIRKVGRFTSIKSQLYALSGILLLGLIITKIITVTLINDEGKSWATECSANLGTYMDCYKATV